ncbi:PilW family protein [Pseudoxanthomonas mexicana]
MSRIASMKGSPRSMRGLSLIELMVALVLGLLVVAAAIGIFLSNRQAYRATESVGRIQENARMAFELMARDVREAGGNACNSSNNMSVINVLNNPTARWWSNWGRTPANAALGSALRGFGGGEVVPAIAVGGGQTQRIANTQALVVMSGGERSVNVVSHVPGTQTFTVQNANHGFQTGDVLLACGQDADVVSLASVQDTDVGTVRFGAIFQMTNAGGGTSILHAVGGTPGNASANLGPNGIASTFGANATISRIHAAAWYIGNGAQGPTLYQALLTPNGVVTPQELIPGVSAMNLEYLLPGANNYVAANLVPAANWGDVLAVRMTLTLQSDESTGTDGQPIRRQLVQVASLRNRSL